MAWQGTASEWIWRRDFEDEGRERLRVRRQGQGSDDVEAEGVVEGHDTGLRESGAGVAYIGEGGVWQSDAFGRAMHSVLLCAHHSGNMKTEELFKVVT